MNQFNKEVRVSDAINMRFTHNSMPRNLPIKGNNKEQEIFDHIVFKKTKIKKKTNVAHEIKRKTKACSTNRIYKTVRATADRGI